MATFKQMNLPINVPVQREPSYVERDRTFVNPTVLRDELHEELEKEEEYFDKFFQLKWKLQDAIKPDEPKNVGDLRLITVTALSSQVEIGLKYPWFCSWNYEAIFPSFITWYQLNRDLAFDVGQKAYFALKASVQNCKSFPFLQEQNHKQKTAHLNRAWNVYQKFEKFTDMLPIGHKLYLEHKTGNELLELLNTFPLEFSEGLEMFWHLPQGVAYLMFLLRHIVTPLVQLFHRVWQQKSYHFDVKMLNYSCFFEGHPVFGKRPRFDDDTDDEYEEPEEHEDYMWSHDVRAEQYNSFVTTHGHPEATPSDMIFF